MAELDDTPILPPLPSGLLEPAPRGAELLTQAHELGLDDSAQDAGTRDLAAMREYLNNDLFAFAQFIFGFKDLIPTLHGDLAAWIADWGWCVLADGSRKYFTEVTSIDTVVLDNRRIMTQVPREFFKTSMGTRANSLWQICREPHLPVALFNERQENAQKWLRGIRDTASGSKLFQQLYRELLPPGVHYSDNRTTPRYWKWSDSELDFGGKSLGEVEPSISAHGIESAATGGHWPKLILDDLISVKHKQSQAEMERAREWLRNHIYLMRPAERSMSYVNCTPWTYTDIYRDCLSDYGYRLYRRAALENPISHEPDVAAGESIFPAKLSTTQLRLMHKRDSYSFGAQMQCIPKPGLEQSFDPTRLKYGDTITDEYGERTFVIEPAHYDPESHRTKDEPPPPQRIPLHQLDKCIILDPAPTEDTDKRKDPHAKNALTVYAMDCWGRCFVLSSWADRVDYQSVIAKAFELARTWSLDRLHVEEVNFSNVYRHWCAREQEPGGKYDRTKLKEGQLELRVFPLTPKGREKHARIMARQPELNAGDWYCARTGTAHFQVELAEYPNSETVDIMDTWGYAGECLKRPLTPAESHAVRRMQRAGAPWSGGYYEGQTGGLEAY